MGLFQQINGESRKRGLEFLVIGGLAVNMHGFMRDTADLDLLVRQESRDEWVNLFSELGYTLFRERPVFCQLDPPQAGAWPVDLMFVREPTFREIFNFGLTAEMCGERLLFPTFEPLSAPNLPPLKHGRIDRYLKDYLDVEGVVRTNRIALRRERL